MLRKHVVPLPSSWSGVSPPQWYDYVLCGWKGIMERLNCDQIGFDLLVDGTVSSSLFHPQNALLTSNQ